MFKIHHKPRKLRKRLNARTATSLVTQFNNVGITINHLKKKAKKRKSKRLLDVVGIARRWDIDVLIVGTKVKSLKILKSLRIQMMTAAGNVGSVDTIRETAGMLEDC